MGLSIYLNAMGILSPMGLGSEETLRLLLDGDQSGMIRSDHWTPGVEEIVGQVTEPLPILKSKEPAFQSRNNQILMAALDQISDEVNEAISQFGEYRVGVVLGSSTSGVEESEKAIQFHEKHGSFPQNYHFSQQEIGTPSAFAAHYLGVKGPVYTVSSACASGGKAFSAGARLIKAGICDAVIVGGADSLCHMTVGGFRSLQAISDEICNPMSQNRSGTNIGEGAAVFLMSMKPAAIQYLGSGESSDAHHISAPDPNGSGARKAMQLALQSAGIAPEQVSYINMHGTATELNDKMESLAISSLFPEHVPVSSTKPLTGHALGAAGAIEAACMWLILSQEKSQRYLPPHVWDSVVDEDLPRLRLTGKAEKIDGSERHILMSNSFAFGGSNVSILMGAD
ncbi:beta-ketoacyl-[acyl-carrier-protein] synthase family protein [Sneathiella glossodoripedis]|uniref:beta-ketoacyl-[acyl-carrier-protein] synthase family protein n=1 Tax=Sneathiella glossodoripedis TaxID=418853 RepID=UPI000AAE9B31|nr:beta-ketoacyl-[acyl-carrier-protein] synthase family protein [Sneathiella glossodoripedis]